MYIFYSKQRKNTPATQLPVNWDDIVFEKRNRDYGAYLLRKEANLNLVNAFITMIMAGLIAFFSWQQFQKPEPLSATTNQGWDCGIPVCNLISIEEPEIIPPPPWEELFGGPVRAMEIQYKTPVPVLDDHIELNIKVSIEKIKLNDPTENPLLQSWPDSLQPSVFNAFLGQFDFRGSTKIRNPKGSAEIFLQIDENGKYKNHYIGIFASDHEFREEIERQLPALNIPVPGPETGFQGAKLHLKFSYDDQSISYPN